MKKLKPLKSCKVNKGFIKIEGHWQHNSNNLHARINRRVGLSKGGF